MQNVLRKANASLLAGDCQWSLQLSSAVFRLNASDVMALSLRTQALTCLAGRASNANARNYYLTTALEDHGLNLTRNPIPGYAFHLRLERLVKSMALFVYGERCGNADNKILLNVTDTKELFSLHIRNGILDVKKIRAPPQHYRTMALLPSVLLREVAGHIRKPNDLLSHSDVKFIGDKTFVKSLFKCLHLPFR